MAETKVITELNVEGIKFSSYLTPPGSSKTLFLGGAGLRGFEVEGKFKIFTLHGVYLEQDAIKFLAQNWKGKSAEKLLNSIKFFRDIVTCPFDKFSQITLKEHLSGKEFSRKVVESCTKIWKNCGGYSEKDEEAAIEFKEILKSMDLLPGWSILISYCSSGQMKVTFSKGNSIPIEEIAVIKSRSLSEAILESIIGENGVCPEAKKNLAARMYQLMNTGENGGIIMNKSDQE